MSMPKGSPLLSTAKGPLPLVLGVTGHRTIREEDRAAIETMVREIFKTIANTIKSTSLVLISSLAEGADRLVARIALEEGARLVVPLPLPRDDYENDFASEESRVEFGQLLDKATQVFEVNRTADVSIGASRDRAYELAGVHVVRHCQILIALWDSVDTGKTGGTWEIVRYKLHGIPDQFDPGHSPLDSPETGPVFQIVTPRPGEPMPDRALDRVDHYPGNPIDAVSTRVNAAHCACTCICDQCLQTVNLVGWLLYHPNKYQMTNR